MAESDTKGAFRRIRLRVSEIRVDEARFLAALDERSAAIGEIDHEFLRRCLLNGFLFEEQINNLANTLATYSNNSHHTPIDTHATSVVASAGSSTSAPLGEGVRALAGLMSGAKSTPEVQA